MVRAGSPRDARPAGRGDPSLEWRDRGCPAGCPWRPVRQAGPRLAARHRRPHHGPAAVDRPGEGGRWLPPGPARCRHGGRPCRGSVAGRPRSLASRVGGSRPRCRWRCRSGPRGRLTARGHTGSNSLAGGRRSSGPSPGGWSGRVVHAPHSQQRPGGRSRQAARGSVAGSRGTLGSRANNPRVDGCAALGGEPCLAGKERGDGGHDAGGDGAEQSRAAGQGPDQRGRSTGLADSGASRDGSSAGRGKDPADRGRAWPRTAPDGWSCPSRL